jgi:hypothetical protein
MRHDQDAGVRRMLILVEVLVMHRMEDLAGFVVCILMQLVQGISLFPPILTYVCRPGGLHS